MKYLVRVRVTRVHEHEIEAEDESTAGEIGEEMADEESLRDSFDEAQLLDVVELPPEPSPEPEPREPVNLSANVVGRPGERTRAQGGYGASFDD